MSKYKEGPLLKHINNPSDLKSLTLLELSDLSKELRQYIIDIVSENGGHLGASLGVVELTIALHFVFDTPNDQLVWDVGHQAYGHKILTGRKGQFHTNRRYNGLSGFPKRSESVYDSFGVGHSSTSISAALGMAIASLQNNDFNKQHIAVIGDGSMSAGMSFEALNHAGVEKSSNLLIILNDNCMSIDPAVGALKEYLTTISTSKTYNMLRLKAWRFLGKLNLFGKYPQKIAKKIEGAIKSMLIGESDYFESLNFRYFGPIDGHDIPLLVKTLKDLKNIKGPKILHCVTTKGKGYTPAEKGNTTKWHAPGLFDKATGEIFHSETKDLAPKYQDVFGESIVELAKKNKNIIGVTPAMLSGSSLNKLMAVFPKRTFDVGIAEQHAVTFSAGAATQGLIPFCNIYSSFMQRAYDQVIHDVALQNLNVVFCLDRGGLVGADGATHHGAFDFAYFRCIPNMIVSAPMNEIELRNMMYTAQLPNQGPFSIRYPRGRGVIQDWKKPFQEISVGTGIQISEGEDVAILSIGHPGNFVVSAQEDFKKEGFSIAHYNMRFVKPLDIKLLHKIFVQFDKIITIEDGCIQGGFGSSILEFMSENNYHANIIRLGIPDKFINHGTQKELYVECNYDISAIKNAVRKMLLKDVCSQTV